MFACKSAISRSCSSEMRGHASSPAAASSASQTSNSSLTSFWVSFAARDPRLGNNTTSPSAASTLSASRSGVRDIAKEVQSSRSGIRAPGAISPSVMTFLRRETTSSCIISGLLGTQRNHFECKNDENKQIMIESWCVWLVLYSKMRFCRKRELIEGFTDKMTEPVPAEANLLYEVRNGVGQITFHRPQETQSLTFDMYECVSE